MVEVEPITCWWRTSTSAVRTGESFGLTLTCSVVETEANKVVADFSKLDPTVVQLPPFEVLGGTHAGDLVTPGKRFFQYDYRLRLIAEDAFGNDVTIPPLEISYRIESKVAGGDTTQGRDQSYSLPRASVRLISLVPDDTTDIREAPAAQFTGDREPRFARQPAADRGRRAVRARRRRGDRDADRHAAPQGAEVGGRGGAPGAAHHSRRGREGARRSAARQPRRLDAGAGRPRARRAAHRRRLRDEPRVGQRPAAAGRDAASKACSSCARSGAATSTCRAPRPRRSSAFANAPAGLSDALRTLTVSRYGRTEKFDSMADEAMQTAMRVTKQQQSAHSLIKEWGRNFTASVVDLRKRFGLDGLLALGACWPD